MAIKIVKLYKPYRGCGSTTTILDIMNQLVEQNLKVAIITDSIANKRNQKETNNQYGHNKIMVYSIQEICAGIHRGRVFDIICLSDYRPDTLLDDHLPYLRTSIIIKEIQGSPPYEIYN